MTFEFHGFGLTSQSSNVKLFDDCFRIILMGTHEFLNKYRVTLQDFFDCGAVDQVKCLSELGIVARFAGTDAFPSRLPERGKEVRVVVVGLAAFEEVDRTCLRRTSDFRSVLQNLIDAIE